MRNAMMEVMELVFLIAQVRRKDMIVKEELKAPLQSVKPFVEMELLFRLSYVMMGIKEVV